MAGETRARWPQLDFATALTQRAQRAFDFSHRIFMSLIGPATLPSVTDAIWRTVYRLGFPLARAWWWFRRPSHEGALVAIHVDRSLLLVQSSYRTAWNFPGGSVRRGETPNAAARRELAEEVGLAVEDPLVPAGEAQGLWDGRRDRVYFFALQLSRLPKLRPDNREIIGARLVPLAEVRSMPLTGPVRAYVEGRTGTAPLTPPALAGA